MQDAGAARRPHEFDNPAGGAYVDMKLPMHLHRSQRRRLNVI
jgi:hypothetical protein